MHILINAYRLVVDNRTKLMMDHLILTIEEVDQTVDGLPTEVERNDITGRILKHLSNKSDHLIHKLTNCLFLIGCRY
ncbi:MAG: hypothetical protein ACI86M_001526 [Saprospiraceae bacterium]|jgi:hypothetical protein